MCVSVKEMNETMEAIQEWKRIKEQAEDMIAALNADGGIHRDGCTAYDNGQDEAEGRVQAEARSEIPLQAGMPLRDSVRENYTGRRRMHMTRHIWRYSVNKDEAGGIVISESCEDAERKVREKYRDWRGIGKDSEAETDIWDSGSDSSYDSRYPDVLEIY